MRISDWSSDVYSSDLRVLRNNVALLPGVSVLGVDDVIHCKGNLGPAKIAYDKQMRSRARERGRDFDILLAQEPALAAFAPDYADPIQIGIVESRPRVCQSG